MAERLGIEQSWLSKIENDKSVPSSDLINHIAEIFELSLDELLHGLDPAYVRNNLASLPEVRGLLQEKKFRIVNDARNWLLAAAVSFALGIALTFAGGSRIVNEEFYLYQSEGLVYAEEPQNLFEDRDRIIGDFARATVNHADMRESEYNRQLGNIRSIKDLELGARREYREIVTADFRGTFYITEDTVPFDAEDFFGNEVEEGSAGTRMYMFVDTRTIPSSINKALIPLGIFLQIFGLGLFILEFRMTRIRSKIGS